MMKRSQNCSFGKTLRVGFDKAGAQTFHIAFSISLCYNETNIRKEHLLCIVSFSPSLP